MIYGDDSSQAMMSNLNQASADFRQVVSDMRAGKGTLGALLVDPSVYEDLKLMLGNVERNRALRALVRYSIKRDEKSPALEVHDPDPAKAARRPRPSGPAIRRSRSEKASLPGNSPHRRGNKRPGVISDEPARSRRNRANLRAILAECEFFRASVGRWSCSRCLRWRPYFALQFGTGGLWRGLEVAHAVTSPGQPKAPYDLTQLVAVNETLNTIRNKYVDPSRVKPRQMFLSAVNEIQKEVAQVIVLHEDKSNTVKVQVDTESASFHIDNVQGPWDVAARLREVFAFLQANLKDTEVDLRDVEYAACNGMLHTLDPHSVFLSPEAYNEMNLSTSGHFGGLGIVISIRDQMLTVMHPMPGTPAGRANLKRIDRITKINNESTLNMPLDDAVNRLRGKPGSKVTIWVHRDAAEGWTGSRPFELMREEIQVKSVDSRGLGNGIGYVRLKQFQASTSDELDEALAELHKKEKLKALVLDLRGNPGGLLDQAARVADRFLDDGVIVATVGASEGREEKRAVRKGTEPNYPIVVLVNGSSASASEIVAGALKNHDRAVIVGQTTFGKGSVQLVFPHVTPENAALKLTIAQYLTPGRRLDPGRGRHAGHRARSDDRRHRGDGSVSQRARPARARPDQELVEHRDPRQRPTLAALALQFAGKRARRDPRSRRRHGRRVRARLPDQAGP